MGTAFEGDHAILGLSIAGVAAALELASLGRRVCLLDAGDGASIAGCAFILPTAQNERELGGEEYYSAALQALEEAGVFLTASFWPDHARVPADGSHLLLADREREDVRVQSVIFAPGGAPPELPPRMRAQELSGRGISNCAWSDALYFKDRPVVVVGCGAGALHQALVAVEWASHATVLCSDDDLHAPEYLRERALAHPRVQVRCGAVPQTVLSDTASWMSGVVVRDGGEERTIDAVGVFNAPDLIADWSLWGGKEGAASLIRQGRLYPSGLAAGIDYWDPPALYADGLRAARECAVRC